MAQKSSPPPDSIIKEPEERAESSAAKEQDDAVKKKEPGKASMALDTASADPLAASAEITSGKAEIKGSLASDDVSRVIKKAFPGLKFCYDEARKQDPTLSGKMKVSFLVNGNGGVNEVKTTEGLSNQMDDCISKKIAQLKFPAPSDGKIVEVIYPLVFTAN
jgi:outer membrane biosynthesis protein TonB